MHAIERRERGVSEKIYTIAGRIIICGPAFAEKWARVVRQAGDVCPLRPSTGEWEAQNEMQMERKVSRRNQHRSY